MKIGFDAKRAFKNRTGLGNYSRMLIGGVASRCPDLGGVLYSPDISGIYAAHFDSYPNLSVVQLSGLARLFPHLWRSYGIAARLSSDGVDIFHGLSHELPHFIPKKVKKVVTMHDLIVWRYPHLFPLFDRIVYRTKMRHSCKIADVVVAASEQTKRDLVDFLHVPEEKIRVVYQSCDPIFWQPVTDRARADVRSRYRLPEHYIICVGTIERRKNQASVVEALAKLPEELHLVIVGGHRTKYYDTVVGNIKRLGLGNRVHILDKATFADFPALYSCAEMSMYVSEFEGFGIPVLESMCCDTPVVTSNVSSMPEVGGEAVLYANPEDVDDIAAKALQLYSDEALRLQLVEKGREQRKLFTESEITRQIVDLYNEIAR